MVVFVLGLGVILKNLICNIGSAILLLFSNTTLAIEAKSTDKFVYVAIPVSETVLTKNDPYFVMLKRAFLAIDVEVVFVEMPGARSFKQLKAGKIAGSYPRYQIIAQYHDEIVPLKGFNRPNPLYVYSLNDISNSAFELDYFNKDVSVGVIRGTLLLEKRLSGKSVQWFSHIDHLVGAMKARRVDYVIESPRAMNRFLEQSSKKIFRSKSHLLEGKVTMLMHQDHRRIVSLLDNHFENNARF